MLAVVGGQWSVVSGVWTWDIWLGWWLAAHGWRLIAGILIFCEIRAIRGHKIRRNYE